MSQAHPLRCSCGALRGEVALGYGVNHAVCYCTDCQAFAHFLGRADDILDARGGTEVVQTAPAAVTFTAGAQHLACVRLTDRGLMRWYASCCNTPLGNTLANPRLAFVGLVHSCLRTDGARPLDEVFGPVRCRANTRHARGEPKPAVTGVAAAVATLLAIMLKARLSGRYKRTPFFRSEREPAAKPRVLTRSELLDLKAKVHARS